MEPMQIRIGDYIARASDDNGRKKSKKTNPETKIAFVENGNIYIELLNKEVLNDIHFN
jgi:septum site-determining protein MinC